jgi:hypothetical protein
MLCVQGTFESVKVDVEVDVNVDDGNAGHRIIPKGEEGEKW